MVYCSYIVLFSTATVKHNITVCKYRDHALDQSRHADFDGLVSVI